jgi:mono/diheme cytochrome c family protein
MIRRAAVALAFITLVAAAAAQPPNSVPQPLPGGTAPDPLLTREVMARGQERYDIFCSPCHGYAGDGDGIVVARGFHAPPSFHERVRRELTPERIVEVISNGTGMMLPMAERIPPVDRWAIATYVKALQLSRQAPAGEP